MTEPPVRPATSRALTVLGVTALLAVILDQVVKELSTKNLVEGEPVEILGGLVHLSLLRNSGAAFSLGSGFTWVFPLVTLAVIGWIGIMARRLRSVPWALALGLVLGGALGNLGDRLFRAPGVLRGHVVDFLQLPHWPIFNVADMCITSAAVLIMVLAVVRNVGIGGERYGRQERTDG